MLQPTELPGQGWRIFIADSNYFLPIILSYLVFFFATWTLISLDTGVSLELRGHGSGNDENVSKPVLISSFSLAWNCSGSRHLTQFWQIKCKQSLLDRRVMHPFFFPNPVSGSLFGLLWLLSFRLSFFILQPHLCNTMNLKESFPGGLRVRQKAYSTEKNKNTT